MVETFGYYLKTGSGSTIVKLVFTDDSKAMIEFDSSWMGSGISRYRLHWDHHQVSEFHGFLALTAIERYVSYDSDATVIEDISSLVYDFAEDGGEIPSPLRDMTYEYIRLSVFQPWIADDPSLEDMSHFFNLARWPETFNLILWMHFSYGQSTGKWKDSKITKMLEILDKMKFTSDVDNEFSWHKQAPSEVQSQTDDVDSISFTEETRESLSPNSGSNPDDVGHHSGSNPDDVGHLSEEIWKSLLSDDKERYTFDNHT